MTRYEPISPVFTSPSRTRYSKNTGGGGAPAIIGTMQALYLDDTITTCDCCGKTGLKVTVVMQLDCGGILHYGRTCAARNSGKNQKQIKQEIFAKAAATISQASWEYKTSDECRNLQTFLSVAKGEPKGWMQDQEERLHELASAKKREIACKYGVSYGSF